MEEKNSKEINLLELISLFIDWLKKVGKSILNLLGSIARLAYRRKITVVVIVAISIGVGQYLARPSNRIYRAEAMATLHGTEAQFVREVCKQIENSLSTNELTSLSTKLSLPDSVTNNIVSFESFYVIDYMRDSVADVIDFNHDHSLSDTMNVRMRNRVYFRLKTRSIAQVPQMQNAILNFLNNNPVIKTQYETHKNELTKQIDICDSELIRIDSLAKVYYFKDLPTQLRFDNDKLLLGEQRKQLFYGELLRLQELRTIAQIKLADFKQAVEIPSEFVVIPVPENGRVKYGVYSIIIGFAIALIIAGLMESAKKIISYLKQE